MLRMLLCLAVLCWLPLAPSTSLAADPTAGHSYDLFNGRNLDGWQVTNCEVTLDNGVLLLKAGEGFARTDHRYGDFTLELEWRALQESMYDSGIYFRAELPTGVRPWPTRYQVNLLQGDEGNVKILSGAASKGLIKPGQWNHFKLTAVGSTASLAINGQPAWKAEGLEPANGYIGLQSEVTKGGQFEFRNIRITEHGHRPLFNGRDLAGWEGAGTDAAACWKVEDGLLLCTGQKGPWLRSAQEYGDFNLRLEYKLKPGGNSGVYVRVPKDGDHRGRELNKGQPSGVEVQILDDADERYAKLQAYQYSGSVYAIAPASPRVCKPAGQWNTMEIDCRGTGYRIVHNGMVVIDAQEKDFPELKNREVKGFLGLQNHSEAVWFRNIRVAP